MLEEYVEWLRANGTRPKVIREIFLPMAGHVLGLALKPHPELDPESDIQAGLDFIKAKQYNAEWTDVCRWAMFRFRRFLKHKRGELVVKSTPYDPRHDTKGLPEWLVDELGRFQRVQQRNWREARLEVQIRSFWATHLQVWRFLCETYKVKVLADVKRKYLLDFVDQRLAAGYATSTINTSVRTFHGLLRFLQEQGYEVPQSLFRIPGLKTPDHLPKFLTDEQVRLLQDDFEQQVVQAGNYQLRRDALMNRAAFYLLWQSGLRTGEMEDLCLEELDLEQKRLTVRQSKGLKDRTVFMTDTTVRAVRAYLEIRGPGPTDHLFLFRNQPLHKDLIPNRLKAAGKRVDVKVHPHRLRHTAATQLLNAGCRVTSIQKFLGHKELSTTMVYARVHDQTVADDYYAAMRQVERQVDLVGEPERNDVTISEDERTRLLGLFSLLEKPDLTLEARLEVIAQMREVLVKDEMTRIELPTMPSRVFLNSA